MAQRVVDKTVKIEDLEKEEKEVSAAGTSSKSQTKAPVSTPKKRKVRGKKYKLARVNVDKKKLYPLDEAVKLLREISYAKFSESVEVHINLGIDPKNNNQKIRFTTTLPHGTGKSNTILVISDDNSGKKGNIIWRDTSVIAEIENGESTPGKDFDAVITTPAIAKDLKKIAKILGPKGLMPSSKTNTVTDDPQKTIKELSKGQIEVKSQSGHAVIHQVAGNLDFEDDALVENIRHLITELQKNSPAKTKKPIQKIYLSTTMSPSVKVAPV